MIIESILNMLTTLIKGIFSIIPNLPNIEILDSFNVVFDTIFSNLQLINCFIRPSTITTLIPCLIIMLNFEKVYGVLMWVINKLPIINIK